MSSLGDGHLVPLDGALYSGQWVSGLHGFMVLSLLLLHLGVITRVWQSCGVAGRFFTASQRLLYLNIVANVINTSVIGAG